jgi:hypothetical protein
MLTVSEPGTVVLSDSSPVLLAGLESVLSVGGIDRD